MLLVSSGCSSDIWWIILYICLNFSSFWTPTICVPYWTHGAEHYWRSLWSLGWLSTVNEPDKGKFGCLICLIVRTIWQIRAASENPSFTSVGLACVWCIPNQWPHLSLWILNLGPATVEMGSSISNAQFLFNLQCMILNLKPDVAYRHRFGPSAIEGVHKNHRILR